MSKEQTLSIIKPNSMSKNLIGETTSRFEKAGLKIVAAKMMHLTKKQWEKFYDIHKEKTFFDEFIDFMSSSPVMVQILEGENAIEKNREIMGATDPKKAMPNTIRADFGDNITQNCVHGSDSKETAEKEIKFFFSELEIFHR